MHAILTKRIDIPWKRLGNGAAIFLSLPSWLFVIATILFWSRACRDDFVIQFLIAGGLCWVSSSFALFLFFCLRNDSVGAKSGGFWFLCSGLPIVLVPLLTGANVVYGLLYGLSHLAGMHDSL